MSKREEILRMLDKGKYISTKDGRCGDTFVNLWALQKLIDDELVTVFLHKGGVDGQGEGDEMKCKNCGHKTEHGDLCDKCKEDARRLDANVNGITEQVYVVKETNLLSIDHPKGGTK